ncbi:unnamed protein product [Clonostachys byssicola]|uniref:Uncharacterized protein n=1 Tax=Clonostachys byssicola TaxID=160290 RepID=A0A9N9Y5T2_9HYPO|nr:unnamed protein product [Clonostachys byssicola]
MADTGESGPSAMRLTPKPVDPSIHSSTVAIEFEEFSLIGPDGYASYRHVQPEHLKAFKRYLLEKYDKTIDDLESGYDFWPFVDGFGSTGAGSLDPKILSDVENGEISNEVLFYLARHVFRECEGISVCRHGRRLVVEFPEIDPDDFAMRLQTLPRAITNLPFRLEFRNGPGEFYEYPVKLRKIPPFDEEVAGLASWIISEVTEGMPPGEAEGMLPEEMEQLQLE